MDKKANTFEKCTLYKVVRKGISINGNPSYWVYFSDSKDGLHAGYTASDSTAGYIAANYKNFSNQVIYLDYHFTKKKGDCVIDRIKHDLPEEATREAENK